MFESITINCNHTSPHYTAWEYVDDMDDPSVVIIGEFVHGFPLVLMEVLL